MSIKSKGFCKPYTGSSFNPALTVYFSNSLHQTHNAPTQQTTRPVSGVNITESDFNSQAQNFTDFPHIHMHKSSAGVSSTSEPTSSSSEHLSTGSTGRAIPFGSWCYVAHASACPTTRNASHMPNNHSKTQ